ncbi:uncharacterized protein isoform X2 [Choristoneura fumiferana]|uniref:uncharacterized protein isoform X2 n=1 Tax=Choristoneura fumiferana TaxID=7141 RepID=UPI003D156A28
MEVEDVIELGSSDEESEVPPRKKMKTVENAMVHIPTKIHGVTIQPVKLNPMNTQKLFSGKNITVTKLPKPIAQASKARQMKTPDKPVQKPLKGIAKKKVLLKSNANMNKNRMPLVINPFSQVKKYVSQPFVNCGVTKLQNPIPIANLPALKKLPPSVTIKKTVTTVKPSGNIVNIPKVVPKKINTIKNIKAPVVQTVELDDEEPPVQYTDRPQWYVRPEEQTEANVSSTQENINNKEPEKPAYIEITIEDSPIKPPKAKRTRELSIETVVTIEDSPNKDTTVNADPDNGGGSDDEPNTSKKIPHSKKKLEYEHKLPSLEETHTFEIEIDPIAVNEPIINTEKESEIIALTPDIVEVTETAVEIAQNKEEDISVVQAKATQSKEVAGPSTVVNDIEENEFSSTYLSFINLCLQLEDSDDMKKIVEKKIKTYYRQVPKEYTQSEEFIDMVFSKVSAIKAAPEKMYLYIKDVVDELNLQRKMAKQMPTQEAKPEEETFSLGKDGDFDPSKQRQIRKLEKTLKKLNRAIHKLEMQEVDFDDDEDSVYLLTEKYKEKMVRVHAKFCQLTNSKMPSEPRLVIEPRPGLAPGPAKRLEAWINKNNSLTFPDFHDVLRCVKEANVEDKLDWTDAFIMEEARDLFIRCGKKLQRRRQEKEWRIATSRVTLVEDPADQSTELKKRLEENRRLASTKETEVLNKFSDRQNQLKLEAVDINDKEAEESPVESEEEENDVRLSLESKQRRKERLKRLLQEQSKKSSTKKTQPTEINKNKEIVGNTKPDDNKAATASEEATHDDNSIQSLSDDDSNEVGSDVDELHLLQKLHSEHERRSDSSLESSGSESPIAISDSSDTNSDEVKKNKEEKICDIISIENSSYSDESDSQQSNEITNKTLSVNIEGSMDIVCSSETNAKDTHLINDPLEEPLPTSSDIECNVSGLLLSEHTEFGKDITSADECLKERTKIILEKSSSITPKSSEIHKDTYVIDKPNHLEKAEYICNMLDDLVTQFTSKESANEFKSDSNNKSNSENSKDVEEPTISLILQPPTVDESLPEPLSIDSCMNLTSDAERKDVSKLTSNSVHSASEEITGVSSVISLLNETCEENSFCAGLKSNGRTQGKLESSEAIRSDDVCTEAAMESEILISNVVSIRKPDLTDETLKENLNPNQDLDDTMTTQHDSGSTQIISNGNSNVDSDLQSVMNSSTKNDVTDADVQENAIVIEKPSPEQAVDSVEKKLEDIVM